jgi:hypothetical protein
MICYELGVQLMPKIERNFMNNLFIGLLATAPYIIIMWQVTRQLNYVPVGTVASYKRWAWTAISVAIGGMVMMILLHAGIFD